MAVMAREAWTDERLDDLNARVERGFGEVKKEVADLRSETQAEFRALRSEMNSRFDKADSRFDSMQRTMIIGFVTLFASIVASVIGGVFAAITLS
jgi:hypothetical protein